MRHEPVVQDLWYFIGELFHNAITWIGYLISSIFGTATEGDLVSGSLSGLLPLVAIPVACAVIFFAIKLVKKISWGY